MRAATITAHGRPPSPADRPDPSAPGADAVLVEVTASPITPLDVLCASGTSYFGAPSLPYVPGVQGVGVVRHGRPALVGRRVWFPTTAGMTAGDGAMAEFAVADAGAVVPLDAELDDVAVAALGLSAVAAWEVLERRAALARDESVLVLAAGGAVGQAAVGAAKVLGAGRVVAAARSVHALERARELGADEVVELRADEDAPALTARLLATVEGGFDVVVDPLAGLPGTAAVGALAAGGRLVNLGSSAGPALAVDSAVVRSRSAAVLGYTNVSLTPARQAEVLTTVLGHAAAGRITVAHDVVPLEDVAAAWAAVTEGRAARRIVLRP